MSRSRKLDERLLSKGYLDNKRLPKAVVKETVSKEKLAKEVRYHLVDNCSSNRGGLFSDKSEWHDNVVNREGINQQNADVRR
jgi:hypothetical protein